MRLFRVIAIVTFSRIARISCAANISAYEPSSPVRFEFDNSMLWDFGYYIRGLSAQVLQFIMPSSPIPDDYERWVSKLYKKLAPEIAEIFNRVFLPKIKALRDDLPKYYCQPLLEDDELRILADLFSDRLEDIFDQIKTNMELTKTGASTSGLVRMALYMALPPLCNYNQIFFLYYPQDLISVLKDKEQYQEGRKQWKEALERAQNYGLQYEGPIPAIVRQPDTTVCQFWSVNWSKLPDDVLLYVLCKTGPYIWYVRLVCKKWRSASSPPAVVGVLGYGGAFKMLSGRMTFDELALRLGSLAQAALSEFNGTGIFTSSSSTINSSGEQKVSTSVGKLSEVVSGLREIVRAADPFHAITWYRDAQNEFPGLCEVIENDIFALFLDARDDVFISMLLSHSLYLDPNSYHGLNWSCENPGIGCRLIRAYLERYPEAARGHSLPDEDSWSAWVYFKGL